MSLVRLNGHGVAALKCNVYSWWNCVNGAGSKMLHWSNERVARGLQSVVCREVFVGKKLMNQRQAA